MERNFGIIFKNARNTAGLTQERWAETLGVSVDAVQNYEYGRNFPTEETVLLMADISGYKILPYQYMSMKSRIGSEILPELDERVSLPKAVLRLMEILDLLKIYGLEGHVSFDFGMLSAYRYYTGVIFRGYTYGTGEAVVKGGRYDNLLAHFGKDAPSAGFVVVLDNLMNALQRQKIDGMAGQERITITYRADQREEAHRKAAALRAQGRCVELIRVG